jgi:hypothetical protein
MNVCVVAQDETEEMEEVEGFERNLGGVLDIVDEVQRSGLDDGCCDIRRESKVASIVGGCSALRSSLLLSATRSSRSETSCRLALL